jgi:hypothetical protein
LRCAEQSSFRRRLDAEFQVEADVTLKEHRFLQRNADELAQVRLGEVARTSMPSMVTRPCVAS